MPRHAGVIGSDVALCGQAASRQKDRDSRYCDRQMLKRSRATMAHSGGPCMKASVAGLPLLVAPADVTKHGKEIPIVGRIGIASHPSLLGIPQRKLIALPHANNIG